MKYNGLYIRPTIENQDGSQRPTVLAVDFDGCLVADEWPAIGRPFAKLFRDLIAFRKAGGKVILWTCREKSLLLEAIAFCAKQGLKLDAANESLPEWIDRYGSDCRKIGADFYLDDRAVRIAPAHD